jgi:bifunctional non-homologous end joining protein LigD
LVLLRERVTRQRVGAIEPCLRSGAKRPPAGPGWIHEIKHDGFRSWRAGTPLSCACFLAGNDLGRRFPFIAMAVAGLPATSCLIDGEEIVCDETGLAVFDLIRGHRPSATAVHCAFDLFELDGEDLRRQPIEARKQRLAALLRGAHSTIVVNEHFEGDGEII